MLQMYLSLLTRSTSYLLSAALAIFALSYPAVSTADNYLDSIEAEAENTTVLQKAQKEQEKLKRITSSAPAKNPQTKTATAAPAPAQKKVTTKDISEKFTKKFESGLYQEFPGNYAVYSNLSNEDKREVIAAYKNAGNIKGLVRYGPSLSLIIKLASK